MTIADMDRQFLAEAVNRRDNYAADGNEAMAAYQQGLIDSHCAQNAIGQADVPLLDLRLFSYIR